MMRIVFCLMACLLGSLSLASASVLEPKKPEPISRPAPPLGLYYYCIDPDNIPEGGHIGTVTVGFEVNQWGRTENVEVLSSTNSCLNLSARTILKVWVYDRYSVLATRKRDRSLQATLEYRVTEDLVGYIRSLMEAEQGLDRDAQPLLRIPPQVGDFQRCIRSSAFRVERVVLEFDVTIEGTPTNIKVIDSTSSCYEKAAMKSVEQWLYGPKIVDRKPVPRTGVQTTIEFQVGDPPKGYKSPE